MLAKDPARRFATPALAAQVIAPFLPQFAGGAKEPAVDNDPQRGAYLGWVQTLDEVVSAPAPPPRTCIEELPSVLRVGPPALPASGPPPPPAATLIEPWHSPPPLPRTGRVRPNSSARQNVEVEKTSEIVALVVGLLMGVVALAGLAGVAWWLLS
jgi:hypothetical protein